MKLQTIFAVLRCNKEIYFTLLFWRQEKSNLYLPQQEQKMKSGHNICMKRYSQVCQKQRVCTCLGKML